MADETNEITCSIIYMIDNIGIIYLLKKDNRFIDLDIALPKVSETRIVIDSRYSLYLYRVSDRNSIDKTTGEWVSYKDFMLLPQINLHPKLHLETFKIELNLALANEISHSS